MTATEKFLDTFGILTQVISRKDLGLTCGPANVDNLYEKFAKAWKETYPEIPIPKAKP